MNKSFKPDGYNSVSPYFIIEGAQRMIDFLEKLFNAKELRRFNTQDGKIMHAEIQIDDSIIMLGDASDTYPANVTVMHVYVPDAEQVYKRAIELGCTPIEQPTKKEGVPDIRGSFYDFAGNIWSVGTQSL